MLDKMGLLELVELPLLMPSALAGIALNHCLMADDSAIRIAANPMKQSY
jgi:ABC-type sulfate transport system permease component